ALDLFRAGAGIVGTTAGADARPAGPLPARAAGLAAAGYAGAEPVGRGRGGTDGRPQARWPVAGVADPAAVYPGIDPGQWRLASGGAVYAGHRPPALARQPGCPGGDIGTFCDSGRPEDQRRRITSPGLPSPANTLDVP